MAFATYSRLPSAFTPAPPAQRQSSSAPAAAYRSSPSPKTAPAPTFTAATASRLASATYSVFPSGESSNAQGCVPGAPDSKASAAPACAPPFPLPDQAPQSPKHSTAPQTPAAPSFETPAQSGYVEGTASLSERSKRFSILPLAASSSSTSSERLSATSSFSAPAPPTPQSPPETALPCRPPRRQSASSSGPAQAAAGARNEPLRRNLPRREAVNHNAACRSPRRPFHRPPDRSVIRAHARVEMAAVAAERQPRNKASAWRRPACAHRENPQPCPSAYPAPPATAHTSTRVPKPAFTVTT
jgi:hypothetical protein